MFELTVSRTVDWNELPFRGHYAERGIVLSFTYRNAWMQPHIHSDRQTTIEPTISAITIDDSSEICRSTSSNEKNAIENLTEFVQLVRDSAKSDRSIALAFKKGPVIIYTYHVTDARQTAIEHPKSPKTNKAVAWACKSFYYWRRTSIVTATSRGDCERCTRAFAIFYH